MSSVENDHTDRLPGFRSRTSRGLTARIQLIAAEHATLEGRCGKAIRAILQEFPGFKPNRKLLTNEQMSCLYKSGNRSFNEQNVCMLIMFDQLVRASGDEPLISYPGRIHPGKDRGWLAQSLRRHLDVFAFAKSYRRPRILPKPSGAGWVLSQPSVMVDESMPKVSIETTAVARRFSLLVHELTGEDVNDYVWSDRLCEAKMSDSDRKFYDGGRGIYGFRVDENVSKELQQKVTFHQANVIRQRSNLRLKKSSRYDGELPASPEELAKVERLHLQMRLKTIIWQAAQALSERVNENFVLTELHTTIVRTWLAFERWHQEWKTAGGEELFPYNRMPLFLDEPEFITGYDE